MSTRKLSKIRRQDPFFEREAARYELPLPSREYIVQTLEEEGKPVSFEHLTNLLDIAGSEREMFQRRLGAMEREGQLLRNRKGAYILPERASLIAGRVQGHPDGYGFFVPDDGSADIFLDQQQMGKVLHGDRALVRVTGIDRKGRPEGSIVEVTERANTRVVGRVFVEHGVAFVVPENRRISQDVLIPPEKKPKFKPKAGQVVMVDIIEQPSRYAQPIGRISEVLGNYADPGMEIEIALRKHDLPFEFSKAALAENKAMPDKVKKGDLKEEREDLRDLALVTIDGETARDFDDAVYCEKKGRGWRLVVAIADVSHYVKPGMDLDMEAMDRGNSVYFPRRVIPMLPEKLSNGICSLNPDVDRLAMVCDMDISATGAIKDYRFYPAVFRSHARLTYTQVWNWLSGQAKPEDEVHIALQPDLQNLYKLFQVLAKARTKRGAIDFETVETQMIFDDQGKIANIVPVVRNDAHRLIEECMLAANVCASDFLAKHKQTCLYRIHEGPSAEKLKNLRSFLGEFGLQLGGGDDPHAKDYGALLEKIKDRPDFQLLQTVMLRSLSQAVYSPDNVGHFGLAYEHYTHFTSPIRRYPDLLIHRAIKAVLAGGKYDPGQPWDDIGMHCSATERRADEATRDVENWLKCYYMKERIGEEFDGTISAVTAFGIFVALDQVYVEGLVHVSELGEDYFQFDNVKHQMLGERTGQRYRLGDRVRVKLVRVDLESNKIDFVLAAPATEEAPKRRARSSRRRTASA
ncbi:MAG TPA: ribonuclease R [Rhodocyclaceae bacterium]|nr:ribonuclease R [Rhodocyclaceae bacterium]